MVMVVVRGVVGVVWCCAGGVVGECVVMVVVCAHRVSVVWRWYAARAWFG